MGITKSPLSQNVDTPLCPSSDDDHNDTNLETLCKQCQRIDWPRVPDWEKLSGLQTSTVSYRTGHGAKVLRIFEEESRDQLLESRCRVCRLVGHLSNPRPGVQPLDCICLEACESLGSMRSSPGEESPLAKLVVRSPATGQFRTYGNANDYTRFLIAHKFSNIETLGIRKLNASRVNFDFFKKKLQECRTRHRDCWSTMPEVTGLRIIDVDTKTIRKPPPGCEYTALSYVWGQGCTCQNTQEGFPQVIQDAIAVTRALGCQYLWVDRYVSYHGIYGAQVIHADEVLTHLSASTKNPRKGCR